MKEKIIKLRESGKTYSEIAKILNCSKSTICYHCGTEQKNKRNDRQRRNRSKQHPFICKIEAFTRVRAKIKIKSKNPVTNSKAFYDKICYFNERGKGMGSLTSSEVIDKFGNNTKCYLTGESIDINKPKTYHFDHKVPVCRGGTNTIENLGICTKQANEAKSSMTHDEFIEFCKRVLLHHGYSTLRE